jgi:hypothetical protein
MLANVRSNAPSSFASSRFPPRFRARAPPRAVARALPRADPTTRVDARGALSRPRDAGRRRGARPTARAMKIT